jgi:diguanylate cyclase (GGDEF)-like protein
VIWEACVATARVDLDREVRESRPSPIHPSVARRLLESARSGESSSLAEDLLLDPGLTLRLIRMANRSAHVRSGKIDTLTESIDVLGRDVVRLASLCWTLTDSVGEVPLLADHWPWSCRRSIIAEHLARLDDVVSSEQARVAGLLWGLGRISSELSDDLRDAAFPTHLAEAVGGRKRSMSITGLRLRRLLTDSDGILSGLRRGHADDKVVHVYAESLSMPRRESRRWANGLLEGLRSVEEVFSEPAVSVPELCRWRQEALLKASIETAQAMATLQQRQQEVHRQAENLRRQCDRLQQQVTLDPLLSIGNRRHFDVRLQEEWNRARRSGRALSLILYDLDRFKHLNDTYFHQAGDEVLRRVTRSMKRCLRSSDVLARYGGEEFAVICPETDSLGAARLADRMRRCLESLAVSYRGQVLKTTASFGVATSTETKRSGDVQTLVACADQLLYAAKADGRNCVRVGSCPAVADR